MDTQSAVGVRELRQNLSVYLDRVKKGETLQVTEHRLVVAVLGPAPAERDGLAKLIAEGRATPARRPISSLPRPLLRKDETPLSRILDESRDDVI